MTEQEYTPTTEQIEDGFTHAPEPNTSQEARIMFRRWLSQHDAEVAARAWHEGALVALDRISNGYDSVLLSDNPYGRFDS